MKVDRKADECGEIPWHVSCFPFTPKETCILYNLFNRDPLKFTASCLICVVFELCNNGKKCFVRWIAIDFQKRFYPLMSVCGRIMFEECSYGKFWNRFSFHNTQWKFRSIWISLPMSYINLQFLYFPLKMETSCTINPWYKVCVRMI